MSDDMNYNLLVEICLFVCFLLSIGTLTGEREREISEVLS
jgi:hypothetical protein